MQIFLHDGRRGKETVVLSRISNWMDLMTGIGRQRIVICIVLQLLNN